MKIQLKEKGQACSNDEAARASVLYISALLGVDNFFFTHALHVTIALPHPRYPEMPLVCAKYWTL